MNFITRYLWYIPGLYVAFMFGNKIVEGFSRSEEFQSIIGVIPFLKPFAYTLTPFVGLLDLSIGLALILNPFITKNSTIQKFLFVWVIIWPFVPASLRYFGGVADFEIVEVLSISLSGVFAFILWSKFANKKVV